MCLVFLMALFSGSLFAQRSGIPSGSLWSAPRSWSVFTEYSPNSSHIFLGISQQRTFFTLGGTFTQRLFLNRKWAFSYAPEVRPLMAESDPVQTGAAYDLCIFPLSQPCTPLVGTVRYPHELPVLSTAMKAQSYSATVDGQTIYQNYRFFYGRRWTYVGGFSPLGFRATFRPRARLQPILGITGGFAVSPRDIPLFRSSAFNFTFSFGAGFQFWRTRTHATQFEYRIQHLSNGDVGTSTDPGIDSQMIHVSYVWGRR